VTARWPGGYVATLSVLNGSRYELPSWTVTARLGQVGSIQQVVAAWPTRWSTSAGLVRFEKAPWQDVLHAGGTATIGMVVAGTGDPGVGFVSLNSDICTTG
jgi:hypothetical protein